MFTEKDRKKLIDGLKGKYDIINQVKFNEFDIGEKLQVNLQLRTQYKELLDDSEYKLNKIQVKYDDIKCTLYDYYRFEHERKLQKNEIEQYYLPNDKKLKLIQSQLDKQEVIVKFFKLCFDSVTNQYWNINTYVKSHMM